MVTLPALPTKDSLQALQSYKQSVWLDYIRRSLISSDELQHLMDKVDLTVVDLSKQVLADRDRQAPRIHFGNDVQAGLSTLQTVIEQIL